MKPLLLVTILAITLISTVFYFTSFQKPYEEETINSRNFFKKWGKKAHQKNSNTLQYTLEEEDVPPIVTYGINFILEIENQNKDQVIEEFDTTTKVNAQCDVQTIYDEDLNIFEVAVSYSMIDKNTYKSSELMNNNLSYSFDEESDYEIETENDGEREEYFEEHEIEVTQIQNYFYLVQVGADSGEVISMKIESEFDEDQIVTNATEQLINDIFPEMRTNSYKKGTLQQDSMGQVHVDYIKEDIDESNISIYKEFNNNDYVQVKVPELGTPQLTYERNTIVENDTGLVQEGRMEYNLQLGNINEQTKLQSDDSEQEIIQNIEALGQINSEIISTFWIIPPTIEDLNIAKEMYRYRNQAEFQPKRLSTQMQSQIFYGNGEETDFELVDIDEELEVIEVNEQQYLDSNIPNFTYVNEQQTSDDNTFQENLSSTRPLISQVQQLASVKILGSQLTVEAAYSGYTNQSNLALRIKVGDRITADILQKTYNHCINNEESYKFQKKHTFFEATYVVYGMIVVPVQASGEVNFNLNIKSIARPNDCTLQLYPSVNIKLYADGQASLAGVISAGVYSQGTLLDTQLVLEATAQQRTLRATLEGQFRAASLDIGITYDLITCSLENITRRKLTQEEGNLKIRRNLWFKKAFRKIKKTVQKTVSKATSAVKQVAAVARKAVEFVVELTQVCKFTEGSISIYSTKSQAVKKTLFNKNVNL